MMPGLSRPSGSEHGKHLGADVAATNSRSDLRHSHSALLAMGHEMARDRPLLLIVEDSADIREYLSFLLRSSYDIMMAEDGEMALTMLAKVLPDLVLTDMSMPRLDGLGLLRQLRGQERTRALAVLIVSALPRTSFDFQGIELGPLEYLQKPLSSQDLKLKIKALLNRLS